MLEGPPIVLAGGGRVSRRDFLFACHHLHRQYAEGGRLDASAEVATWARRAFAGEPVSPPRWLQEEVLRVTKSARQSGAPSKTRRAAPGGKQQQRTSPAKKPAKKVSASKTCAHCQSKPRYAKEAHCSGCLKKSGWIACSACSRLFLPRAKERRCAKCVAERRRTGGRGGSVWTLSGGLPTLGKDR